MSDSEGEIAFEAIAIPVAGILVVFGLVCFTMWLSSSIAPLWGLLLMPWLARKVPEDCNGHGLAGVIALICAGGSLAAMFQWTESHGHDVMVGVVICGMLWFAMNHFWSSAEDELPDEENSETDRVAS